MVTKYLFLQNIHRYKKFIRCFIDKFDWLNLSINLKDFSQVEIKLKEFNLHFLVN